MTGLIPLLQRLDDSRRVCALYLSEGHPHLADLARDLPTYRMTPVDLLAAAELERTAAGIDRDQIAATLGNLTAAWHAAYTAGLRDGRDPADGHALSDDALTVHFDAIQALEALLGVYGSGAHADEHRVRDLAARARETAADIADLEGVPA